jgi:hypothetical protein
VTVAYDITYTIRRDGEEIGFGASGYWENVDAALYAIDSDIQNRRWETSPGMPDPEEAE